MGIPSLIYIAGLGHSGSTLLDILLSSQPGITGLGEVDTLIHHEKRETFLKKFQKRPCTCGKLPADCPVWSAFREALLQEKNPSFGGVYKKLLEITHSVTGAKMISDSSKRLSTLKHLFGSLDEIGLDKNRLKVIHLVKDVRSFTASVLHDKKLKDSTRQSFRKWKTGNRKIESFLNKNNIAHLRVGYEELTLSTEFSMGRISEFLGFDPDQVVTELNGKNAHIAFGNHMRFSQADKIVYDYRWFNNGKIHFQYTLSPGIRHLNTKWVYGNVGGRLSQKGRFQAP